MTITIEGRTRFADQATTRVEIRRDRFAEPVLVLTGGLLEQHHSGAFTLNAKHLTGTDEEHDSAYVACFEGGGLTFSNMTPSVVEFNGVIFKAQFYPEEPKPKDICAGGEECRYGNEPHPIMKFTPPTQKRTPGQYLIRVTFTPVPAPVEAGDEAGDDAEAKA